MYKITCSTCLDLMPLVKDGIASEDSCNLVNEHLANCKHCSSMFEENITDDATMDEIAVLGKIKKQILWLFSGIMLAGTLLGLVLSDGMGMFYNVLIMPMIGAFGYILLRRKSYFVLLALFLFSITWILIREANKGTVTYTSNELLLSATWWAVIFTLFSAIGILIAWLLDYAFRKDNSNETKY